MYLFDITSDAIKIEPKVFGSIFIASDVMSLLGYKSGGQTKYLFAGTLIKNGISSP